MHINIGQKTICRSQLSPTLQVQASNSDLATLLPADTSCGPDYLDTHHVGLSFTNFSSYPYLKQYILDWLSTLLRIKILFL